MPALRHPERFVRLCLAARLTAALLLPAVVESQAASVLKKYTTADSGRTNLRPATRRNSHDVRVAVVAWRSGACCQRGHGGFDCVAHNGGLIPVPGRDIMIQAWYQGGASIFDFTDPKKPVEIALFDRGPIDATKTTLAGFWSLYWYNGLIYGSEIGRGLDILELVPSEYLSQNEIDAAKSVHVDELNAQLQKKIVRGGREI